MLELPKIKTAGYFARTGHLHLNSRVQDRGPGAGARGPRRPSYPRERI